MRMDLWMEWAQNLDGSLAPVVVVGYFLLSFSSLASLDSSVQNSVSSLKNVFYENV